MPRILWIIFIQLVANLFPDYSHAECDINALPEFGERSDVLVLINTNSIGSCVIGKHYAQARNLGKDNVALIKTPTNYFIDWNQFRILRNQVIARMQQLISSREGVNPVVCSEEGTVYCNQSLNHLANYSEIRYLVTTYGVPTRTRVNNNDPEPASVDALLRASLYEFNQKPQFFNSFYKRPVAFADGSGMRSLNVENDREMIVGRLDGLTVGSAKKMIDRTILAEQKGIYGNVISGRGRSQFEALGDLKDWSYGLSDGVFSIPGNYLLAKDPEQYLQSSFNDSEITCIDEDHSSHYLSYESSVNQGKAPENCVVKIIAYEESGPGRETSRVPDPVHTLIYSGVMGTQTAGPGTFQGLLNWRRNTQCQTTLCEQLQGPDRLQCQAESEDVFKEIDTRCVGVADGFIGYKFRSFPVSYLWAWPTSWSHQANSFNQLDGEFDYSANGDQYLIAFPWVRFSESDQSHSLWFGQDVESSEDISQKICFSSPELTSLESCHQLGTDFRILSLQQLIDLNETSHSIRITSPENVKNYAVQLMVKTEDFPQEVQNFPLRIKLGVHRKDQADSRGSTAVSYLASAEGTVYVDTHADNWQSIQLNLALDPSTIDANQSPSWNGEYDGISLKIESLSPFQGKVGFNSIHLKEEDSTEELIKNSDFDEGHKSLATGDNAAFFLSRLNGVAFWGSVGHYVNGGHSFSKQMLETVTLFKRGLPLGDAVWYGNSTVSGVFYGDPLFSPIGVYLKAPLPATNNNWNFIELGKNIDIHISVMHGRDIQANTLSYSIDVCHTERLETCDLSGLWINHVSNVGRGDFNLPPWGEQVQKAGVYWLRLSVNSQSNSDNISQTFNDIKRIVFYDQNSDFDKDQFTDVYEMSLGSNPLMNIDSDADGIPNDIETIWGCSPIEKDSDNDFIEDGVEWFDWNTDPCQSNLAKDSDGDGFTDVVEMLQGSDPKDPLIATVDPSHDSDMDGLTDLEEIEIYQTHPLMDSDSDGDGISDSSEISAGLNYLINDNFADADGDGYSNLYEYINGTDFLDPATFPKGKGADQVINFLMD